MSSAAATSSGVLPNREIFGASKLQIFATTVNAEATDKSANDQCLIRRHHRKKPMENTRGTANENSTSVGSVMARMLIVIEVAYHVLTIRYKSQPWIVR